MHAQICRHKFGRQMGSKNVKKINFISGGPIPTFFQMDWVCGDSWKAPLTQGIHFAGGAVGTLLFGLFADRFGRLPRYIQDE